MYSEFRWWIRDKMLVIRKFVIICWKLHWVMNDDISWFQGLARNCTSMYGGNIDSIIYRYGLTSLTCYKTKIFPQTEGSVTWGRVSGGWRACPGCSGAPPWPRSGCGPHPRAAPRSHSRQNRRSLRISDHQKEDECLLKERNIGREKGQCFNGIWNILLPNK